MEGYRNELIERKSREATENSVSSNLKKWCRMIKKEILAPATKEEADSSMPTSELMSAPMEKAKTYAETLGIIDILDSFLIASIANFLISFFFHDYSFIQFD